MFLALAILVLQQAPSAASSVSAAPADAFLDETAGQLLAAARAHVDSVNTRIQAYEVLAKERVHAGISALRRDRVIFRRELAYRIRWEKGVGSRITTVGAREALPLVERSVGLPSDAELASNGQNLAFDPSRQWLLSLRRGRGAGRSSGVPIPADSASPAAADDERSQAASASDGRADSRNGSRPAVDDGDNDDDDADDDDDDDFVMIHPLERGSEAHYRFRTGSTTTIRLSGGKTITLVELEVIPRRAVYSLVSGSLWLDQETHAAVRGTFTMAAPFQPPLDDVPIPLPEMSFTLQYITVEYGLWQDRWWLPKLVAFEGSVTLAGIRAPLIWEQAYEDYRVYGEEDPIPALEPVDTLLFRVATNCEGDRCENRAVLVPRDTASLIDSPDLPPSIFGNDRLMTAGELDELQDLLETQIAGLGLRPLPTLSWEPLDLSLMHYNRVEGLTFGTSATVEFGSLQASGAATAGTADLIPRAILSLTRSRLNGFDRISLYHRVDAFVPDDRPFSLGSSFSAFALGRDDGDYYSATGVSVGRRMGEDNGLEVDLGVHAELQRSLEKQTDASIPAWTVGRSFRPNPPADEADQVGATVTARWRRGLDPAGFRAGADASLLAEQGTYGFARPALTVRTTFPLPVRLAGALEAGVGTSFGELPAQREWFVGGQSTVRGFRAEERMVGSAFWRARAEIGSDRPAFRLIVFSDAGWAGDRSVFAGTDPLISAGVGASALDGLVRADLARTLQGGEGRWGLTLYLDAAL